MAHPLKYRKPDIKKLSAELGKAQSLNAVRELVKRNLSKGFRRALVSNVPEFYLLYYLGIRLPRHQRKWIRLYLDTKYLLELAPRDHGKSWMYSYGLPLYEIYASLVRSGMKSVDARILEICKTDSQGDKYAGQVGQTIQNNIYLAEDFGDVRDLTCWLKGHFRCRRDTTDSIEKDYTYEKVGILGAITGGHFHRINGDDILDDENTKTLDRMETVENWFWGTIWNLREPYTRYSIVGTRKHRRDLYSKLLDSPVWIANIERAIIKYPMIPDPKKPDHLIQGWLYITTKGRKIDHPSKLRLEKGEKIRDVELLTDDYKVLWPPTPAVDNDGNPKMDGDSGKPMLFGWGIKELLLDRAAQGSTYFDREKQNAISAEEGAIFNKNWFSYFDTNELFFNAQDGYTYLVSEGNR